MSEARKYHDKAMELLNSAEEAELHSFANEARQLFHDAYNMEKQAAYELLSKFEVEPTRSVLFRSAATLAQRVGLFEEARRLVYLGLGGNPYTETENELKDILSEVTFAIMLNQRVAGRYDQNSYLEALRETAINLRLCPKDKQFEQAIPLDYIIEFLQNIQRSYENYVEINYRKQFPNINADQKYDSKVNKLKQETKAFCVGLKLSSFGVSVSADTGLFNYHELYKKEESQFKRSLFKNFKEEVFDSNLESSEFQDLISEKYSTDEQVKIFSPIVDSLKEKSKYRVEVTDSSFRNKVREYSPLTRTTELFYKGYFNKKGNLTNEQNITLEHRTDVVIGNKKQLIEKDVITSGSFKWIINTAELSGKQTLYFINPYEVTIELENNQLSINDEYLDISLVSKDYEEIKRSYLKELFSRYNQLADKEDKTQTEKDMFDHYKSVVMTG